MRLHQSEEQVVFLSIVPSVSFASNYLGRYEARMRCAGLKTWNFRRRFRRIWYFSVDLKAGWNFCFFLRSDLFSILSGWTASRSWKWPRRPGPCSRGRWGRRWRLGRVLSALSGRQKRPERRPRSPGRPRLRWRQWRSATRPKPTKSIQKSSKKTYYETL